MDSLFDTSAPLASRLRPDSLDEYVGQRHLLDPGGILYRMISQDRVPSMIFWGPPGRRQDDAGSHHCEKDQCPFH